MKKFFVVWNGCDGYERCEENKTVLTQWEMFNALEVYALNKDFSEAINNIDCDDLRFSYDGSFVSNTLNSCEWFFFCGAGDFDDDRMSYILTGEAGRLNVARFLND